MVNRRVSAVTSDNGDSRSGDTVYYAYLSFGKKVSAPKSKTTTAESSAAVSTAYRTEEISGADDRISVAGRCRIGV